MPTNTLYHPSSHQPWLELGPDSYDLVSPATFPKAILRFRNQSAAQKVGLDELTDSEWKDHFWSFNPFQNNLTSPLALRYHGHQFTHYNPELGDGRGFLFAHVIEAGSERLLDLATKGSGQTPWSRRGDGRLTLKGAVREALATAFLESHGVNTSKTFSIYETGEALMRNDEPSPTRSAVLTRLSHSHVRIGTFERLSFLKQNETRDHLSELCLKYYFPQISVNSQNPCELLFLETAQATAKTTAQWMLSGFVHGVLNTDNINITGESFDYGPYRFLPHYDTKFVAAYFDHSGLYAYGRQPYTMLWNLERFGEALGLSPETLQAGMRVFQDHFNSETMRLFLKRLHLKPSSASLTQDLFSQTIYFLEKSKAPFEGFFFDWFGGMLSHDRAMQGPRKSYYHGDEFLDFQQKLKKFIPLSDAFLKDDYFLSPDPETLLIDEIENIWDPIDKNDDWSLFYKKLDKLNRLQDLLF